MAMCAAGCQPVAYDEADLHDLFLVHEQRTVVRGTIPLIGQRYYRADLLRFNGETVQIDKFLTHHQFKPHPFKPFGFLFKIRLG